MADQFATHTITYSQPPEMSATCSCGATSGPQESSSDVDRWVEEHGGTQTTDPYWAGAN